MNWTRICSSQQLREGRGVAALVDGQQVAVVRIHGSIFAMDHRDPACQANVLARGIVGSKDGKTVLISPMYKHAYDVHTGECVTDGRFRTQVHHAREMDGFVEVALTEVATTA